MQHGQVLPTRLGGVSRETHEPNAPNFATAPMILIGQYDSPFVRRVGIALTLYGLPFEHRPWSVFGDAEKVRQYNPLVRVPTLVLDDGLALVESGVILDYLDSRVPAAQAMLPT